MNPILLTDSYKITHWRQYPKGTERVYSFFESRGGRYPETVFFGLQYYLKNYLQGYVLNNNHIAEAKELFKAHFGDETLFNEEGWHYIRNHHEGRLPVRICAVPEGTIVPVSNVLMTIENTDPKVPWLTNYLETLLSMIWYPMTVATQSHFMRKDLLAALEKSGDPKTIDFKLHDFGFRGVSSVETAGLGAAAHLLSFKGTDTIAGITMARKVYGASMPGFSIPASEHSTITSWGRVNECEAFANMLQQYPTGLVACVSDSYDIYKACAELWPSLKVEIEARDGMLVIRPDSGDPHVVLPRVLEILGEKFGYTTNERGFKVLTPKIRIIQGDGIDSSTMDSILDTVMNWQWSADNLAFGSGGGLLQKLNRDTQKCAFKCSAIQVNGEWRDVYKEPITDPGKNSKKGRFSDNLLVPVFEDGKILKEYKFDEIVKRVRNGVQDR